MFFQPFHLGDVTTRGRSDRYFLWVRVLGLGLVRDACYDRGIPLFGNFVY